MAKTVDKPTEEKESFLETMENNYDDGYYPDDYCPSSTSGDYSPSCPWNAPGMSIRDFI